MPLTALLTSGVGRARQALPDADSPGVRHLGAEPMLTETDHEMVTLGGLTDVGEYVASPGGIAVAY